MAHASEFDFVIINSVFENALDEFCAIVTASRLRFDKQRLVVVTFLFSSESRTEFDRLDQWHVLQLKIV